MFDSVRNLETKRILRIGAAFLIFFAAINIYIGSALPSYSSTLRASEKLLKDNVCNFAYKDFTDIKLSLASDEKPKIFLLGDSISYGIGVKEEKNSVSGYLRDLNEDYSVYNLSSCGSKPLDYYLWISYLTENFKDRENIYVIQYNYKWFNADSYRLEDKISQKRVLLYFNEYVNEHIRESLKYSPGVFERLDYGIDSVLPVSANKIKLFATIFNEKSKEKFVENLFFGSPEKESFEYKTKYWRGKNEMKTFNCKISYGSNIWDEETNFNYQIYLKTLELLSENNQKALTFMPPYNKELTKKCQNGVFEKNIENFVNDAEKKEINTASFINLVNEEKFLDDMHTNEKGNKELAEAITEYINKM